MKTLNKPLVAVAVLLGCAAAISTPACALSMKVLPYTAVQFGTGSGVQLGHTVIAGTNINRLIAGGTFLVECDRQELGTIPGSRTLSSNLNVQYNQLYVTIPDTVPSLRNLPGFINLPRGQQSMCHYNWTAFAEEGTYTIGAPPLSITVGGAKAGDSGVVTFWMKKPGTADGDGDACIP